MSPSITPPPVPPAEVDPPVAEEVGAPTDPKTLAKIAVAEAIKNATMAAFDGDNFIINAKTITFKTEGVSVPTLRSFCHKNDIRSDDGKSLRNANRAIVEKAIKDKHRRINAGEDDPWKKSSSKKEDSKSTPVNRFRLANVMYGEAMKVPLANRGATLKKNDLIVSSTGSKTGDMPFYEAAMKEYNKKHEEYDTLHFADNIVVDDKNLPDKFIPLKDWRDLKNVYKEVTASLDKVRHTQRLSGTNDSDGEEDSIDNGHTVKLSEKTKTYLIYWNLFANQDPDRFRNMNRELPEGVFFDSEKAHKKKQQSAVASKTKKKKKNDNSDEIVAAFDRGTKVDYHRLQEEKDKNRFVRSAFQIDSLTKLKKEKHDIVDRREKRKMQIIDDMEGDTKKKRRKEYQCRYTAHCERKKQRGGTKDPLTQESCASDFDYLDELELEKKEIEGRIAEVNSNWNGDKDNGNNNAGDSNEDAIAID